MKLTKMSGGIGDVVAGAVYGRKIQAFSSSICAMLKEAGMEKLSVFQAAVLITRTVSAALNLSPEQRQSVFQMVKDQLKAHAETGAKMQQPGEQKGWSIAPFEIKTIWNKIATEMARQGVNIPRYGDADVKQLIDEAIEVIAAEKGSLGQQFRTEKQMGESWDAAKMLSEPPPSPRAPGRPTAPQPRQVPQYQPRVHAPGKA